MRFEVITIFPNLFDSFLASSLIGKAVDGGRIEVSVHDLRRWALDSHRTVDDEPYGGGGGMVMKPEPWLHAVRELSEQQPCYRILFTPQGDRLTERRVRDLAGRADEQALLLLCGRYEGLDDRVRQSVVDEELSIGDFVLSGGELPAMVLIEALSRQVPGVVGLQASVEQDSFRQGLLDHPHYTRPREVEGLRVPETLLSGNHETVRRWRLREALRNTLMRRPDLLRGRNLSAEEKELLEQLSEEGTGGSESSC